MSESFVATNSPFKMALLIVGGLAFAGFGALILVAPERFPDLLSIYDIEMPFAVLGWVSLIFFGLCAVAGIGQLRRTGPVMEISAQGLRWRNWSDDLIPWAAIERAQIMRIQRQHFLSLWLRDPGAYRSTTLAGKLAGANKAMGFGDIALTVQGTDRRFDDMVEAFRDFAPQLLG